MSTKNETTAPRHTPEPWELCDDGLRAGDDRIASGMDPDDAVRARACVNACAGRSPEALGELEEADAAWWAWLAQEEKRSALHVGSDFDAGWHACLRMLLEDSEEAARARKAFRAWRGE